MPAGVCRRHGAAIDCGEIVCDCCRDTSGDRCPWEQNHKPDQRNNSSTQPYLDGRSSTTSTTYNWLFYSYRPLLLSRHTAFLGHKPGVILSHRHPICCQSLAHRTPDLFEQLHSLICRSIESRCWMTCRRPSRCKPLSSMQRIMIVCFRFILLPVSSSVVLVHPGPHANPRHRVVQHTWFGSGSRLVNKEVTN